jgi:hypothetical protein
MTDSPRFILGFGTAKAGSTWLYDHLARRPDVCMPVKEAMVFHALFGQPPRVGVGGHALPDRAKLPPLGVQSARSPETWRVLRTAMLRDPDLCIDHYRALASSSPRCRVVGDISPSYAKMDLPAVEATAALLERGGFDVRAVFVMRDPVDRLVSHYRYRQDRGPRPGDPGPGLDEASILAYAADPAIRQLHDYPRILANLQAVFPPERLFVGFFEEFFTDAEQQRLGASLGFADWRPDVRLRSFESRFPFTPSVATKLTIRRCYDDEYRSMADLFGADRIAAVWPNVRA